MNWFEQLLFDSNSIAHIVLLYTAVISLGVYLGKIKFFGISLGVTFVLFAGILAGHFGFTGPVSTLNFQYHYTNDEFGYKDNAKPKAVQNKPAYF